MPINVGGVDTKAAFSSTVRSSGSSRGLSFSASTTGLGCVDLLICLSCCLFRVCTMTDNSHPHATPPNSRVPSSSHAPAATPSHHHHHQPACSLPLQRLLQRHVISRNHALALVHVAAYKQGLDAAAKASCCELGGLGVWVDGRDRGGSVVVVVVMKRGAHHAPQHHTHTHTFKQTGDVGAGPLLGPRLHPAPRRLLPRHRRARQRRGCVRRSACMRLIDE